MISSTMVREALAHCPMALTGYDRWEWLAQYFNRAMQDPNKPCMCCNVTPDGDILDHLPLYGELVDENDELKRRIEGLESLRPVWAQGPTPESVTDQVNAAALASIWNLLGVDNQTEAMQRLHNPTRKMAQAFKQAHDKHAAAKIPKIYVSGQREEANIIVGLRAALNQRETPPVPCNDDGSVLS